MIFSIGAPQKGADFFAPVVDFRLINFLKNLFQIKSSEIYTELCDQDNLLISLIRLSKIHYGVLTIRRFLFNFETAA